MPIRPRLDLKQKYRHHDEQRVQLQDSVVDEILDPGRQKWRPYGSQAICRDGLLAVRGRIMYTYRAARWLPESPGFSPVLFDCNTGDFRCWSVWIRPPYWNRVIM